MISRDRVARASKFLAEISKTADPQYNLKDGLSVGGLMKRLDFAVLARAVMPEGRLIFRAVAYGMLATLAFAIPASVSWWVGVFLSYMAFNLIVGKAIANFSDAIYRILTRQPVDRDFIRWRNNLALLCDVPDGAYELYGRGLTEREARDLIVHRINGVSPK